MKNVYGRTLSTYSFDSFYRNVTVSKSDALPDLTGVHLYQLFTKGGKCSV